MRLYLAGPMTGRPLFNFPAFAAAAAALRERGYKVVNPAERDSDAVKAAAAVSTDGSYDADGKVGGETWGEILARDVRIVADEIDGIVFLPDWDASRGARLEAYTALLSGKKHFFYYAPSDTVKSPLWPMSIDTVRSILRAAMP